MRGFTSVAGAVLRRNLIHAFKNPALLVPSIVFPLVFLTANAGGLSNVANVPGFHWTLGYTAFQFVFVFLQAAAFGGVFTGFAIAADFETGFGQRLLLASPRRGGIIAGYVLAAVVRYAVTGTVVTVAALLAGMRVAGSAPELARPRLVRAAGQHDGDALGRRAGVPLPVAAGRPADADPGVPDPVPHAGVRPA